MIPIKEIKPDAAALEFAPETQALFAEPLAYNRRTAKIARYFERTKGGKNGAPISMQVALTDRCFNRCIMCDHPLRAPREIAVNDWLWFLGQFRGKVESVCYSGGDPMAYRDFNQVMDFHIRSGIPFGATITGYIPPFIDIAKLSQAAWIRVSLDAVTPEVYAVVRGKTPVSKVIEGIDDLLLAGAHVGLGITVHKQNEGDLPNVLAFARSRGISDIDVRPVYPDSLEGEPNADRNIQPFNNCHAALYQLYIDADGAVYPCCITAGDTQAAAESASLGNILHEPWGEVWARVVDYTKLSIEQLPSICRSCCVQRLSEINHVCGKLDSKPSFF